MFTVTTQTVTIDATETDSNEVIDLHQFMIVGIKVPSVWTAATIGFSESKTETGTPVEVQDGTGAVELAVAADTFRALTSDEQNLLRGLRYTTLESSVAQAGARELELSLVPLI